MTVKRYGSVLFDAGLIEMACGDYVTYSDHQKLVAENLELKAENCIQDFIITAVKDLVRESEGVIGWHRNGDVASWDEVLPELSHSETPATDAAIAEIKAQGVDEFKDWNDTHIEIGDEYADILREVSKACSIFAANLRAGRKG